MSSNKYAIAIHGGAGQITRKVIPVEDEAKYQAGLQMALGAGKLVLAGGGSALEAVMQAVIVMENNPLFNAGKGSVFNFKGEIRMDAALMDGASLNAGAVSNCRRIKNPITLANKVLTRSEHVLLGGSEASDFANENDVETEKEEYFRDEVRYAQWLRAKQRDEIYLDYDESDEMEKFGTVGAVALDQDGNLAAATSTGGMTNKKFGRIGDSPIIGAGTYANNSTCAISCTGQGEFFMRHVTAHRISNLMELGGLSLEEAANQAVHQELRAMNGKGGLIAVDAQGNIAMPFNTGGMFRAAHRSGGEDVVAMFFED